MSDEIYRRLAKVLDTLPNGFPATASGVELRILKKIFSPEDAELFCDLRLAYETAGQIAQRTGRDLAGLDARLQAMSKNGQLMGLDFGGTWVYKMLPWVFGIYEFQLERLDRELCELVEEYAHTFGPQFFSGKPQLMQVVPVEREIAGTHEALPYEHVSNIIEKSKSFRVTDCICKKEKKLLDKPCRRTMQVCMSFAPVPGIFESGRWPGRVISKEEAYRVLARAEEEALVHLTWNMQDGLFFICNCCGCCCGVLRGINEMGLPAGEVVSSHYYAAIDPEVCAACGTCATERCQVNAIEEGDAYRVVKEKCIGCGLCVSTCPQEAIKLVRKDEKECVAPPQNEAAWFEERGQNRGTDFSRYK
jgi:ferredoxin